MTRASSSAAAASSSAQPPPQPDNIAETITPAELVALIKDEGKVAGKDYLIVDVRRTEFDDKPGNVILPGAINLPAQTFYASVETIYEVLHGIPIVIFHCNSCRPRASRGARCAGWYADELIRRGGGSGSKSFALEGGMHAMREYYPELLKVLYVDK